MRKIILLLLVVLISMFILVNLVFAQSSASVRKVAFGKIAALPLKLSTMSVPKVSTLKNDANSGTWGTASWTFDPIMCVLSVQSGDLTNLTENNEVPYQNGKIMPYDIKTIIFSRKTTAPADSAHLFDGLTSLTKLDVAGLDTSNVTNMSYMFSNDSVLTTLKLDNFNTSHVTDMSYMFNNDSVLKTLKLDNFNTNHVTNMSYMFSQDSALNELDISTFDTSKVTDMSYMFCVDDVLTTLDLSTFDTRSVTNMEDIFTSDSSLTTLNLSNFDTTNMPDYPSNLS